MTRDTDAEAARFDAFLAATESGERDWIAFCEFEQAIDEVTDAASMVNGYDDGEAWQREKSTMRPAIAQMLYGALPKVGFGTILADACGIGYAIRFGVIQPTPTALDHVTDDTTFETVAAQGYDAERAEQQMRMDALLSERKRKVRRAPRGVKAVKVPT